MIAQYHKLALTAGILLAMAFTFSCSDDKPDGTPSASDFSISGTGTVYYDGDAKAVTVLPQAGKSGGKITVYYEGKDADQYPKVDVAPIDFGEYIVTFDVGAADGWNGAIGLSAGTLSIEDGTPTVPSISNVAIQSSNSIKVSWGSVPRATSYKVFYITEGMDEVAFAEEVTSGTSFTHTGLAMNGTYYYFVIAVNSYGKSTYSDFKSIRLSPPAAPANLEVTVDASNKISVRWGAVEDATGYRCDLYNGSTLIKQGSATTGTSYAWSGLTPGTTYNFRAVATNAAGGNYSTKSATTLAADYKLNLEKYSIVRPNGLIWLMWDYLDVLNDRGYDLYYSVGSPDNFKFYGSTNSTAPSIDFNGSINTKYYFYVKVQTRSGHSEVISLVTGTQSLPQLAVTPAPAKSPLPTGGTTGQKMCPTCSGNGKCHRGDAILVGNCQGGKIDCSVCLGKGTYNNKVCTTCKGAGKVKCGLCNGTGKCHGCNGKGKI